MSSMETHPYQFIHKFDEKGAVGLCGNDLPVQRQDARSALHAHHTHAGRRITQQTEQSVELLLPQRLTLQIMEV